MCDAVPQGVISIDAQERLPRMPYHRLSLHLCGVCSSDMVLRDRPAAPSRWMESSTIRHVVVVMMLLVVCAVGDARATRASLRLQSRAAAAVPQSTLATIEPISLPLDDMPRPTVQFINQKPPVPDAIREQVIPPTTSASKAVGESDTVTPLESKYYSMCVGNVMSWCPVTFY